MEKDKEKLEKQMEVASKHYSDDKFWGKLRKFAKKAGALVVYAVLLLYYTLQKPEVPVKTKSIIIGALGIAILQVTIYIDEDIKSQTKEKLKDWFGDNVDTSDIDAKIG